MRSYPRSVLMGGLLAVGVLGLTYLLIFRSSRPSQEPSLGAERSEA